MNFGETLAYWYLRLNGFFPLSNFVFHRIPEENSNSDTDLLAMRWPNVEETINEVGVGYDSNRFSEWGINLESQITGLIVEVKTGKNAPNTNDMENSFSPERIKRAIKRFGFWDCAGTTRAAEYLSSKSIYSDSSISVGKLLISSKLPTNEMGNSYLRLKLEDAENFILNRVNCFNSLKQESRLFFPSDLMQYIIWKQRG